MNTVKDRQNYRRLENETNNAKGVHWVEEILLEDLASYLKENSGINGAEFESRGKSQKIYDPEAIDVTVIESKIVSWEDEVKDKSRAVKNWFETRAKDKERRKGVRVKIEDNSDGKQFLKSQWQRLKLGAIALASRAKKALAS